jgi:hypothetical protein
MTSSTLMIPPTVRPRLREGFYVRLRDLGTEHSTFALADDGPHDVLIQTRAQLERVWRLLDKIGWTDDEDARTLALSVVGEDGSTVIGVTEFMVSLLDGWLTELDPADPCKRDRTDELQVMRLFAAHARDAVKATTDNGAHER